MSEPAGLIAEMRRFNRFYTRTIGVLEETLTASPFTLTERGCCSSLAIAPDRRLPTSPGSGASSPRPFI